MTQAHPGRDSLGDRMKLCERAHDIALPARMPVILRVDGKAFHTWTRSMDKPFDLTLVDWMNETAIDLCGHVQGAQFAYVQSDEISILLHNYKRFASQAWLENRIQKVCSVSASIAAAKMTLLSGRLAHFDARAFVLSEAEVTNYFLWRQNDATRHSIQMLARSLYSHKQCENKDCNVLQELCFQKGHNWNDLPTHLRRGRCVVRDEQGRWVVDREIPIWKEAGRQYVERFLETEPEEAQPGRQVTEITGGLTWEPRLG
jgi:tRNA(His) 5'-end guanylyltransferase